MPSAEVDVDEPLVRRLLAEQHPDLAARSLRPIASGWDNAIFRLGDDLAVRLPRREIAARLVGHEHRWLPQLAPRLPLPVPVPLRVGRPGCGFPWAWTICPWLEGAIAADEPPSDPDATADVLGAFLAALHRPAPPDAPVNPYRGIPLARREGRFVDSVAQLADVIDAAAVRRCWARLADTPPDPGPPRWLHGDLHPANLLVRAGRLAGVLDFGDLTAGDRATDLSIAWMLLPSRSRTRLRDAAGAEAPIDDATWARARAWALHLSVAYLAGSADHPVIARIGRTTLAAVLADD